MGDGGRAAGRHQGIAGNDVGAPAAQDRVLTDRRERFENPELLIPPIDRLTWTAISVEVARLAFAKEFGSEMRMTGPSPSTS